MAKRHIAVVGGGPAGFFGAIACAETNRECEVTLFEATGHLLSKVIISGGGRCNVTHACFEPRELVKFYPRGSRELLGAFHRFQPRDTVEWFASRGVELKREDDGRMFPITDDSRTIADCLMRAAEQAGVAIRSHTPIMAAESRPAGGESGQEFVLQLAERREQRFDRVLLATGGNRSSRGLAVAQHFGHTIAMPVPSLFTFHIEDERLVGLEGIAAPHVSLTAGDVRARAEGPLLITHWGVSGPATLRFSAWAARELAQREYRFVLNVNWLGDASAEGARAKLVEERGRSPRKKLVGANPFGLPGRLWERLVTHAKIPPETLWGGLSNQGMVALAQALTASQFAVTGKSMNKEEFVTCGGVQLSEVDFKTMQSRICPGLHFAGEMLDIDGITGGFNFQAAWTTGWLAGQAMAAG